MVIFFEMVGVVVFVEIVVVGVFVVFWVEIDCVDKYLFS